MSAKEDIKAIISQVTNTKISAEEFHVFCYITMDKNETAYYDSELISNKISLPKEKVKMAIEKLKLEDLINKNLEIK